MFKAKYPSLSSSSQRGVFKPTGRYQFARSHSNYAVPEPTTDDFPLMSICGTSCECHAPSARRVQAFTLHREQYIYRELWHTSSSIRLPSYSAHLSTYIPFLPYNHQHAFRPPPRCYCGCLWPRFCEPCPRDSSRSSQVWCSQCRPPDRQDRRGMHVYLHLTPLLTTNFIFTRSL